MLKFPPKRILVGADLADASIAAWQHAAQWGQRFGASVRAVHSRGPEPLDIPSVPRIAGGVQAYDRDLDEEFRRRTGATGLEIEEGDPVVSLLRIVRVWKADVLVVGTHGRKGVPRLLLGSVAEALVRESPVPVLAVHAEPRPVRSVLVPMNFTSYADQALLFAAAVAANFEAKLTVHHVAASGETFAPSRAKLEEALQRLPESVRAACSPRPVVSRGTPAEEIARASGGYDLVVLSAHRRGILQDLLVGSTAQQVLRAGRTPLLAVPAVPDQRFAATRWSGKAGAGQE